MGHQNTDAGFAPDVDDLFQCLGHVVGLIAHMHVEDAVVAGRDFGERDEFFRGLVLVGRVDEPRRNAARAFLHAPGHAFFHKARSSAVGGLSSMPMTSRRTVPSPT